MTDPNIVYNKILYKNSGDQPYGDKARVVGYYSLIVSDLNKKEANEFSISNEEKIKLLQIARSTIQSYASESKIPKIDTTQLSPKLLQPAGAFVSLHKNHKIRGCIGRFEVTEPLYKVVQKMAVASAFHDCRFAPVTNEEIPEIVIQISILSPMKRIHQISEIELGRHGVYMVKGRNTGTFLPQVAKDTGWDLDSFLGHCARDKARIGWYGWKTAELYVYEADIFDEYMLLH